MTRRQLVLCGTAALAARAARAETPQRLTALLDAVRSGVNPDAALEQVRRLYSTDRWFTFPRFEETARHIERTLRGIGLERVEIVAAPADGVTQSGFWTMPLAWDVKSARLELIEPEPQVLGDYQQIPCSLGMWSGPTPPGGITAEVVEFEESEKIRGKLALTKQNPQGLKARLVKWGALGALNAFSENPTLAGDRQWINGWGDKGWAFNKGDTPLLCFSLTPRQGELLRGLLAKGRVRVKAQVDSRYYSGSYPYITGVIPGSGSEEEVLTLGHTSEQGAHDNATGIAAMLESLATLSRLIASGKLARPQRTIRILTVPELYGSMHYVTHNPERVRRTIAAMCLDTPAGPYTAAGTEYTWHLNPHAGASYVDAFILRLAEEYFPRVKRPWHSKPFTSGTDNYLGDPSIGIPTVWAYSGTGVHTHHNSADTPDTVDARSLRDLSVMNAAFLYFLAAAGQGDAEWLAEITLTRAYQQVARAAESSDAARIAYAAECGVRSLLSAARVDGKARIEPLVRRIEQFRDSMAPAKPAPKAEPTGLVVRRKRPGTIPLDEIPEEKREGFPSAAWDLRPMTALYWCDGKRDLAEVIRLTRLELGPLDFDFTGYFRFLERKGYVEFVRS